MALANRSPQPGKRHRDRMMQRAPQRRRMSRPRTDFRIRPSDRSAHTRRVAGQTWDFPQRRTARRRGPTDGRIRVGQHRRVEWTTDWSARPGGAGSIPCARGLRRASQRVGLPRHGRRLCGTSAGNVPRERFCLSCRRLRSSRARLIQRSRAHPALASARRRSGSSRPGSRPCRPSS